VSGATASDPHRLPGIPRVLRNLFLKISQVLEKVSHVLEQHAQRRIHQAVHSSQLRRVQRDFIDLQREMHPDNSGKPQRKRDDLRARTR
jgi:hypothetical protein